jgi:sugar/nucleoside kinase (ribokinase family)
VTPTVVCLGPVILDMLGRACVELPPGQIGQRISEIRITAAGTGAGTAVDLAKLDTSVTLIGAIGRDDAGDFLLGLLAGFGVDTSMVQRTDAAQTSASLLPIRPNGDRGAYHVVGANAHLDLSAEQLAAALDGAAHLHVGGAESMGQFIAEQFAMALRMARQAGATTSVDVLASGYDDDQRKAFRVAMPVVDYFMPNDQQICAIYDVEDVDTAAALAINDGAGTVVVACGAAGALVARGDERVCVPALPVDVVDTTGCGDALSAAFIRAKLLGWDDIEAARLGCTAGSLVATGLGSDAGLVDLESTIARSRDLGPNR